MYKVFQSKDFNKYDEAARNQAKSFWSSQGYTCTDHENEYDVDLVVEKDGKMVFVNDKANTLQLILDKDANVSLKYDNKGVITEANLNSGSSVLINITQQ